MDMKAMATMKKYKGAILAGIGVLVAIAVVIMCGLIASCSPQADAGSINAKDGVIAVMEEADSLAEDMQEIEAESAEESSEQEGVSQISTGVETEAQAAQPSGNGSQHDSTGSTPATSNGAKSQSASSASQSTPQKKWVENTQQVWVEDRAAWTESVPVYGAKEVSICNVCGSDITGSTASHAKAHMMAGEGSGHHSEVRKVVTGYNTVSHPAEGHWETKVIGGHWE